MLFAFIATGPILLFLLSVHIVLNGPANAERSVVDRHVYLGFQYIHKRLGRPAILTYTPSTAEFWMPIIVTLILSLSDQMLLTGLSMMIATFTLHCSISVYHVSIVIDLAWFAAGAHLMTLSLLHRKLQGHHRLRNSRVVLMIIMAVLLVINTFWQGHWAWYHSNPFPAQCPWNDMLRTGNVFGGEPLPVMIINLALIFVLYTLGVIQFYRGPSRRVDESLRVRPDMFLKSLRRQIRQRKRGLSKSSCFKHRARSNLDAILESLIFITHKIHYWFANSVKALLVSMSAAFALNVFWFIWGVKNIIVDRRVPQEEHDRFDGQPADGDEHRMGFGQIVPLLLLGSTVLVTIEAYEGMICFELLSLTGLTHMPDRTLNWRTSEDIINTSEDLKQLDVHRGSESTLTGEDVIVESPSGDTSSNALPETSTHRMDTEMGRGSRTSGSQQIPGTPSVQRRPTFPCKSARDHAKIGTL